MQGKRMLGTIAAATAVLLLAVATASGTDPRLGDCAGPPGKVGVAFDLVQARDLWQHIPGFLKAPELEVDAPAHVVVYDGPVTLAVSAGSLTRPGAGPGDFVDRDYENVVCVAIGGDPTYYSSVDLSVVKP